MLETLQQWFGLVCGQNPAHTWAPGGVLLPLCQRCTGLYVGAAVAGLLHLWLRPKFTGRFLEGHGAFLLLMVPFGFHWLPQGAWIRTVSGVLFGSGVVTFLWLPLAEQRFHFSGLSRAPRSSGKRSLIKSPLQPGMNETAAFQPQSKDGMPRLRVSGGSGAYWLGLAATLLLVPAVAQTGGSGAAGLLCAVAAGGAAGTGVLVVAALSVLLTGACQLALRRLQPGSPA